VWLIRRMQRPEMKELAGNDRSRQPESRRKA